MVRTTRKATARPPADRRRQSGSPTTPPEAPSPTPEQETTPPHPEDATVEESGDERIDNIEVVESEPAPKAGRPVKGGVDFFRRLGELPAQQWQDGKLIIYVYRLQPFTDRHAGGQKSTFILKYTSPIDEETILLDHGSGKYRFMLLQAVEGTNKMKTLDTKELDILHPKFPPKVPPGEWVDDPRNKKWAWGAPKDAAAAAPAGGEIALVREVLQQIRDNTPAVQQNSAEGMAKLLEAMKPDPNAFVTTLTKMKELSGGGESSAVMTLVLGQLTAVRDELKEERAANRALLEKLIEIKTAPPAEQPKAPDPIEQLTTMFGVFQKARETFGAETETAARAARGHMTGWQEFFAPAVEAISQAVAPAVSAMLTPGAVLGAAANPTMVTRPAPAGPDLAAHIRTFQAVREPMLSFLNNGISGAEFASWFIDGYGSLQYEAIRAAGAERIISVFRRSPMWAQLAAIEQRFVQFIGEFVAGPEEQPAAEPGAAATVDMSEAPPIDLTQIVNDDGEESRL